MIHIIEGQIGSGKTYWIVCWILERFFTWSARFFEYMPKGAEDVKIFSNVRGLKLGKVIDLQRAIADKGGLEGFFSVDPDTHELLNKDLQNAVIIIDEAQGPSFFPRKFYNPKVTFFFQVHRHYGIEIFLATQDVKTLCPELRELAEFHIHATRASLRVGPYLRYKKMVGDDCVGRSQLKLEDRIFALYNSQEKGAKIQKPKTVLMKYAYIGVISLLVILLAFWNLKRYFTPSKATAGVASEASSKKSPGPSKEAVGAKKPSPSMPTSELPKPNSPLSGTANSEPPPIPKSADYGVPTATLHITPDCELVQLFEIDDHETGFRKHRAKYICDDGIYFDDNGLVRKSKKKEPSTETIGDKLINPFIKMLPQGG